MSKELDAYQEKFPSGSKFRVVCGNDEGLWAKKGHEGTVYDLIDNAQDGICIRTKEDVDKGYKSVWVDVKRCEPIPEQPFEVNDQGGMKETSGKLRWTLLPLDALKEVVKVLEYGARKYSADNWQKVDKEKYKEALWRHWVAYNQGEKKDPETGLSHLAHLLCDGLFLLWFDLQEDKND